MKTKTLTALCAAALITLSLAGCGQQTSQAEYIGIDAAKAIALESAGVSESSADFSTAGLDKRNGTDFYAVDFTVNGQHYEYDIDAVTGVIIDSVTPAGETSVVPDASADPTVPAGSGQPASGAQSGGAASAGAAVTEERAREIALENAGLTGDQVTFIRSHLDWDDGRQIYDVEFYTADYTEYDYEIDASTGEILSYDFDAEGYTPPAVGAAAITADQAREIALAKVPGATASDIYEFEVDRDDGRLEYEGTIFYSGTEYEFTIDGYSGAIRSWEADVYGW